MHIPTIQALAQKLTAEASTPTDPLPYSAAFVLAAVITAIEGPAQRKCIKRKSTYHPTAYHKDENGKPDYSNSSGKSTPAHYTYEDFPDQTFLFHNFATEGDPDGTSAMAIIESVDGTVESVLATNIRFIP